MKSIDEVLRKRAARLGNRDLIAEILGQPYILAGGAMRAEQPRDYDIYGLQREIDTTLAENVCWNTPDVCFEAKTNNAVTVKIGGQTVQFCKFFKPTPMELIESFDFSHIQSGAVVDERGEITDVVYTRWFELVEKFSIPTGYMGSEYPLSSLKRMIKFIRRGDYKYATDDTVMGDALRIVCDIVKRGFKNEDDFEDQCASISSAVGECDAQYVYDLLSGNNAKLRETLEKIKECYVNDYLSLDRDPGDVLGNAALLAENALAGTPEPIGNAKTREAHRNGDGVPETTDDILREMRSVGRFDEKSTDKIPRSLQALGLLTYADRFEAAYKREMCVSKMETNTHLQKRKV